MNQPCAEQNRKVRKVRRREERGMCVSPKGALQSRDKPYRGSRNGFLLSRRCSIYKATQGLQYADERNVGWVYDRKVLFNPETNHIYRARGSHNGSLLSRRRSIYKAN